MNCNDQEGACPGDCEECGEFKPLSSEVVISRAIDFAVNILAELDSAIPDEKDFENVAVSVNATRLAGVCEALLSYCEEYDGVDVKELFLMAESIQEYNSINHINLTVH